MATLQIKNIQFTKGFKKQFQKLPKKAQSAFFERLELFQRQPFLALLHNHGLVGKYTGMRSINITGDYRAVFEEVDETTVKFYAVGTHSKLYG